MGEIFPFEKNKLICAITISKDADLETGLKVLTKSFGRCDFIGEKHSFDFTKYYEKEMGEDLLKILISFEELVTADELAKLKIKSNELEQELSKNGNRQFNFDLGILDESRLILASTKKRGHRLPLKFGIYGELTLLFMYGKFSELPWTYSDFKSDIFKEELLIIRKNFLSDRKKTS